MGIKEIPVSPPFIRLDSFMKLSGMAGTGGQAKMLVQDGLVQVNGAVCLQRGKKLVGGDTVQFDSQDYHVKMG